MTLRPGRAEGGRSAGFGLVRAGARGCSGRRMRKFFRTATARLRLWDRYFCSSGGLRAALVDHAALTHRH